MSTDQAVEEFVRSARVREGKVQSQQATTAATVKALVAALKALDKVVLEGAEFEAREQLRLLLHENAAAEIVHLMMQAEMNLEKAQNLSAKAGMPEYAEAIGRIRIKTNTTWMNVRVGNFPDAPV